MRYEGRGYACDIDASGLISDLETQLSSLVPGACRPIVTVPLTDQLSRMGTDIISSTTNVESF